MKRSSSDKYISSFPPETQKILKKLRDTIRKAAPNAEESIKYGILTYVLNGNLVHFGGFKKHIGFYPSPSGIKVFEKDISMYKTSKGAIQFSLDKPLPLKLITKIVKFRVKENLGNTIPKQKNNPVTCSKGHKYYKTSGRQVCPICAKENKPKEGFLSYLNAPDIRSLKSKKINSLKKLSKFTKTEIINLHGIGISTISILDAELRKQKLTFKKEE